ncbi:MAG: hypothetical protein ACXACD_18645, partial [Candidatus Thorarchaeota archaeon]
MYIGGSNVRRQLLIGFIGTLILIIGSIASLIVSWVMGPFGIGPFSFIGSISLFVSNIAAIL